jgi:hypothetical protein
MDYEERNQKQTRDTHYNLFANRGSEKLGPIHKCREFREELLSGRKNKAVSRKKKEMFIIPLHDPGPVIKESAD